MSIQTPAAVKNEPEFINLDSVLTVEEWAALPDTKPRYELINGILVRKMTTKRRHTQAATEFLFQCILWGKQNGWEFFSEGTGVDINSYTAYVPDVVGFQPGAELDPDESHGGAPFLVAEVLSPRTATKDRTIKKRNYASIGVQLYVLIAPDARTVEIYRLQDGAYGEPETLSEDATWKPMEMPGLELKLNDLWM